MDVVPVGDEAVLSVDEYRILRDRGEARRYAPSTACENAEVSGRGSLNLWGMCGLVIAGFGPQLKPIHTWGCHGPFQAMDFCQFCPSLVLSFYHY